MRIRRDMRLYSCNVAGRGRSRRYVQLEPVPRLRGSVRVHLWVFCNVLVLRKWTTAPGARRFQERRA